MNYSPWEGYLFQYIIGGAFFLFGLFLAFRTGEADMKVAEHRRYVVFLLGGLALYALFHGAWIWLSLHT